MSIPQGAPIADLAGNLADACRPLRLIAGVLGLMLVLAACEALPLAVSTPSSPADAPTTVGSDGFIRSGLAAGPFGTGAMRTYRVDVEPETGLDANLVAEQIGDILGDPRSWIASGSVAFDQVSDDDADLVIRIARPATVDRLCRPLRTNGQLSCRNGRFVNLNLDRWQGATSFWPADLDTYRAYLVNHEVGHHLGRGHVSCPGAGRLAPVMMQQSKGLGACQPNGWPYP